MKHVALEDLSLEELFRYQRKLAGSHNLLERLKLLYVAAQLSEQLALCSDHEIGDLLSLVRDVFGLFSPEFAICQFARRRLQRRDTWREME